MAKNKRVFETTVKCFMCGKRFTPDPAQWMEWGQSGRSFDPTEWACKPCQNLPEFPHGEFDDGAHWRGE